MANSASLSQCSSHHGDMYGYELDPNKMAALVNTENTESQERETNPEMIRGISNCHSDNARAHDLNGLSSGITSECVVYPTSTQPTQVVMTPNVSDVSHVWSDVDNMTWSNLATFGGSQYVDTNGENCYSANGNTANGQQFLEDCESHYGDVSSEVQSTDIDIKPDIYYQVSYQYYRGSYPYATDPSYCHITYTTPAKIQILPTVKTRHSAHSTPILRHRTIVFINKWP
jgi:hypothetical protein